MATWVCIVRTAPVFCERVSAMKRAEVKNLLFGMFQERIAAFAKRRDECDAELSKMADDLVRDFGKPAETVLADFVICAKIATNNGKRAKYSKIKSPLVVTTVEAKPKRTHKRKTTINVSELLRTRLPGAVKVLGKKMKEFTSRDMYDYLVSTGINKQVRLEHISLQLMNLSKKLGIKSRKKKSGGLIPRPINFFSLARQKK